MADPVRYPTRKARRLAEAPPTIWYKAQRVLRTIVAVLTSFLTVWGAFVVIAPQVLEELAKVLPVSWILWLTAAIAAVTAVAGVITRIMAIPQVNAWLTKIGLGSVPKNALVQTQTGAAVIPDPKVSQIPPISG